MPLRIIPLSPFLFLHAVSSSPICGASQVIFLWINSLAALHVVARCFYGWAYVTDRDLLRSLFWSIGFFAALSLYLV
jgi:uncharacterized MAPEG superfamily protein